MARSNCIIVRTDELLLNGLRPSSEQSVDELWALHEGVIRLLSSKMMDEKARPEKRLRELQLQSAIASDAPAKRPYPPVLPKYCNPLKPSETWAPDEASDPAGWLPP